MLNSFIARSKAFASVAVKVGLVSIHFPLFTWTAMPASSNSAMCRHIVERSLSMYARSSLRVAPLFSNVAKYNPRSTFTLVPILSCGALKFIR